MKKLPIAIFYILFLSLAANAIWSEALLPKNLQASEAKATKKRIYIPPKPPKDLSRPGRRSSAGSRMPGENFSIGQQVIAIVPEYERVENFIPLPQIWVLTTLNHPTFWFYVPHSKNYALTFLLERQEIHDKSRYHKVYQREIEVLESGFLAIALPKSFQGLEKGEIYKWSLRPSISIDHNLPLKTVEGWVEFKDLSSTLKKQIAYASPTQAIDIYSQNGIWLDMLNNLFQMRQASPTTSQNQWEQLLKEINLETLSNQKILKQY